MSAYREEICPQCHGLILDELDEVPFSNMGMRSTAANAYKSANSYVRGKIQGKKRMPAGEYETQYAAITKEAEAELKALSGPGSQWQSRQEIINRMNTKIKELGHPPELQPQR